MLIIHTLWIKKKHRCKQMCFFIIPNISLLLQVAIVICICHYSILLCRVLLTSQSSLYLLFQTDAARARPSGILRVFPWLCGRGSCRDGFQTLLRPGLVIDDGTHKPQFSGKLFTLVGKHLREKKMWGFYACCPSSFGVM